MNIPGKVTPGCFIDILIQSKSLEIGVPFESKVRKSRVLTTFAFFAESNTAQQ